MFRSVLVALAGQADFRDALALGARLTQADGALLVAHAMTTSAGPLTGGSAAAAHRRDQLRDAGEEIYAAVGPDPRIRFVPLSGLPFADAVTMIARRERSDAIVIGQNLLARGAEAHALVTSAPCHVAVAPYGYRFVRLAEAPRIIVACGPPADTDDAVQCGRELAAELGGGLRLIAPNVAAADEWLEHAQRLAPTAAATRVAGHGRAALVDQTRSETDILLSGRADEELLRQTVCPVLIVPASDSHLRPVSAAAWR
jgi:nucleotide-binding universal stress UspA family protein